MERRRSDNAAPRPFPGCSAGTRSRSFLRIRSSSRPLGQHRLLALAAINAFCGSGPRDDHRHVADAWRAVSSEIGKRVRQIVLVVALAVLVRALVRAARFPPLERGVHYGLRDIQGETELDRRHPFGVERAIAVIELDSLPVSGAQLRQTVAGRLHGVGLAKDADAGFHRLRHLLADLGHALALVALQVTQHTIADSFRLLMDRLAAARRNRADVPRRALTGNLAEDQQFRERVRAEAVGAVDADAGAFARGEKPGQRRLRLLVAKNAAH